MADIPIASTQFHHAQLAELQRLVPQIMWGSMAMTSLTNFTRGGANIPLSGGGGGSSTPTPTIASNTIPLNIADPGLVFTTDGLAPAGANEFIIVNTNRVLVPSNTRVVNGFTSANYIMNGTNTLDVTAFHVLNGASFLTSGILTGSANQVYNLIFNNPASLPVLPQVSVFLLGTVDASAPTITSAAVANGTRTTINLTFSEAIKSVMPASMTFAVSAGHALTGVPVYVDPTHVNLVTSTPFANPEAARTLSYTIPPTNPIQDLAGNNLQAFSGLAITNNVVASARTDNFTRADSATLMGPPSDGGSNYVVWAGGPFGIVGNKGYCTTSAVDSIIVLDTGNTTIQQYLEIQTFLGQDTYPIVIFRATDASNFMNIVCHVSGGDLSIQKRIASGSSTNIATSASLLYTAGDTIKVQPRCSGNLVEVWLAVNAGAFAHVAGLDYTIGGGETILTTGTYFGYEEPGINNACRLLSIG